MNPTAHPPVLSQTAATREYLGQARRALERAGDLLRRPEPDYRAAAEQVEASYRASLRALIAWHGATLPEAPDVRALGERAVQFASILRTFIRRALALLPTLRAAVGKERLGVHEREGVATAWYTARNLYEAVVRELPERVWEAAEGAVPAPA